MEANERTHLDLETLISALHDSEINGVIGWFYDGVWSVKMKIGDPWNGYDAEATVADLREASDWLRDKAIELYPDSEFAKRSK